MEQWAVELQLHSHNKATTLILKEYENTGMYIIVSHKFAGCMHLSWFRMAFSVCITQPLWFFWKNKNVCWHAAPWEYISQQVSLRELVAGNPTSSVSVMSTCARGTRQKITSYFPCLNFACRHFESPNPRKRWISSQRSDILVQTSVSWEKNKTNDDSGVCT